MLLNHPHVVTLAHASDGTAASRGGLSGCVRAARLASGKVRRTRSQNRAPPPWALSTSSPRCFAAPASTPERRRAYARERSAFFAWCSSKHCAALPATLAAYRAALAEGTATGRARKPAGIDLALAAITAAHKDAGLDSPRDSAVRRGIFRELGTAHRKAAPLLTLELRRTIAALLATIHGARDRAAQLLLGWAGGFRSIDAAGAPVAAAHHACTPLAVCYSTGMTKAGVRKNQGGARTKSPGGMNKVLFVRAPEDLLAALDSRVESERDAHPGHNVSRADVARQLLYEALKHQK